MKTSNLKYQNYKGGGTWVDIFLQPPSTMLILIYFLDNHIVEEVKTKLVIDILVDIQQCI